MSRDSSVPPSSFFSSVHAPNIQLDDSGTKVSRNSGTYNGLAFSYQQIEIGERVSVALELNHDYDGDLRIGVTTNDPANINQLPKYSCPMLCGKVGYWLAAIPASNGVENNSRITFYLTNNGSFQLFVNGNHKGAILTNLPTKDSLWIVFDLFGRTVSLTLIKEGEQKEKDEREKSSYCDDHVPVEIVSRGQAAVEAYRKTLSSGCIPIYRTRLMIVGPKGSGKTTLKNLLVKPLKIDSNESMVNKNFVIDTFTKFMIGESRESSNIPQWQKLGRNDSPETSKNRNSKYQEESSESFVLEYEKNLEEEYHKAISKNIVRELLQQKKLIEDKKRNSAGKARQLHFNKKTLSWKRSKQDGKKFYDKKEIDCKVNAFELPDQICDMVEKLLQEAEMKQDWDKIETEKQSVNCVFCPSQVEVNLWDWSGDPDNFIIQQPFFSSKAVYLVVFDISKSLDFPDQPNQNCNDLQSSYLSQIQFWLQSIYNHASTSFYQPHLPPNKQENSSPAFIPNIVLIGTHKNQLHADCAVRDKIADSKFHRIKESIQEKAYKECIMGKMFALDICDSYCSLSDSIRNIQSCLETVIQSQWHMGKQIPLKYLAFEQSINKLVETKTNCADLGTLQTIAESDGIMGEEGLKIMLQYFYTFGTLLFFDSVIGSADEDLRNIVVLSPHWLMESFRACLYPPTTSESGIQLLESEGKLLPSALFNVVPDIQYNVPVILGLLEKFELICDTSCNINIKESEKTYLVPLRAKVTVDDSKREAQPNETNAVEFYFKFTGFVFDSVFTRLLTRTIKWCYCNSNNGGKYLKFSKYLLRFDFDDQHDVKMQLIFHDRIKVTVIRMEKISSSGVFKTESETQRVNSQKKPIPEVCAMVRHFLESSLEDIRVMWEKRMVFQSSVVCWCSKDCNLHNRKSCTDEKCQHFLALDECLIKKDNKNRLQQLDILTTIHRTPP
ncbi:Protein neuralized [Nymphon striatum]|nr:Protein neuralized [Nymphon striatum]